MDPQERTLRINGRTTCGICHGLCLCESKEGETGELLCPFLRKEDLLWMQVKRKNSGALKFIKGERI
jgi:hypothetical protein